MRVPPPRFPSPPEDASDYERSLHRTLNDYLRVIADQVNGVSENRMHNKYNALTAAPTGSIMAVGDFTPNGRPFIIGSKFLHIINHPSKIR